MIDETHRIDRIRLWEVRLPFKVPFRISTGCCRERSSLIVELESRGVTGYGESAPDEEPFYSHETLASARVLLQTLLLPRISGKTVQSIEEMNRILNAGVRGNPMARAGPEQAYWDLVAKRNGLPLRELIRQKLRSLRVPEKFLLARNFVESGLAIGIPEDEDLRTLARWIEGYLKEGYRRVKIKIRPGWDTRPLEVARSVLPLDFPLSSDANGAFEYPEHLPIFKAMDRLGCLFYEQPLDPDDLLDHANLAREVKTPICLDESLKSARVARQALDLKVLRVWNLKIQRVGGLLEALRIYAVAVENGIRLWVGTMPETAVGTLAAIALGTFSGFYYPSDVEPSRRWYEPGIDLADIEMDQEGRISLADGFGIGIEIDRKRLEKFGKVIWRSGA